MPLSSAAPAPPGETQSGPGAVGSQELQQVRAGWGGLPRLAREIKDSLMLSRGRQKTRAKGGKVSQAQH